jgi:hypothetical protein
MSIVSTKLELSVKQSFDTLDPVAIDALSIPERVYYILATTLS